MLPKDVHTANKWLVIAVLVASTFLGKDFLNKVIDLVGAASVTMMPSTQQ